MPGDLVIAEAAYRVSQALRDGSAERGLSYIVGVTPEMVVFTEEARWEQPGPLRGGRPQTFPRLAEEGPRPVTLGDLAQRLPRGPKSKPPPTPAWRG